ncbi:MAG: hypothetical protein ACK5NK_09000 [Niabella sp.]
MKTDAFKIARILGILLAVTAITLMPINPKAEYNLDQGFRTPIIAFEFAKDTATINQLFNVSNVAQYKADFKLGVQIDFGFMFLYSGLVLFVAIGIYQRKKILSVYIFSLLCLLMVIFDTIENIQILQIIQLHPRNNFSTQLNLLHLFTWLKWSSIAIAFLYLSSYFFLQKRFGKIIGFLQAACLVLLVVAYFNYGLMNEIFSTLVSLNFLCLIVFVFTSKLTTPIYKPKR